MPYKIIKEDNNKYRVINSKTGQVHAKGTTKAKAEAQFRLLNGVETGWKPTGKPVSKAKKGK